MTQKTQRTQRIVDANIKRERDASRGRLLMQRSLVLSAID